MPFYRLHILQVNGFKQMPQGAKANAVWASMAQTDWLFVPKLVDATIVKGRIPKSVKLLLLVVSFGFRDLFSPAMLLIGSRMC